MRLPLPPEAAQRFCAAARKCSPGRRRGPDPPVRVTAVGGTVTLSAHFPEATLALAVPVDGAPAGTGVVPMAALAGPDPSLDLTPPGRRRDADLAGPPAVPDDPAAVPPEFLTALHECGRAAAREPDGRYALHRVQVRGTAGQVVGTDARQALAWGGFVLPFPEDLLVPAVPVFGSRALAVEADVRVGRTAAHLVVAAGPWTVWLGTEAGGRFPDVAAAAPRSRHFTVLDLAGADAAALARALPGLPGADQADGPVTLDLGPAARARNASGGPPAEVPLPGSFVTGPPVTVLLSRAHLGRALALGLRRFRFAGPDRPWVASDGPRAYLAATLSADGAAAPAGRAGAPSAASRVPAFPPPPEESAAMPPSNGRPAAAPADDPPDPAGEAEALKACLAEAHAKAARLAAALRQYRKDRRALASAVSSLRHLNLGP